MKEFKPQLFNQHIPNDQHQRAATERYGDWVRLAKHVGFFELVLWLLAPTDGTTLTITEEGKPYICLWDLPPDKFMDLWMKGDPDLPKHLVDKEPVVDITNTYKTIFKLQCRGASNRIPIARRQVFDQCAVELINKAADQTSAMGKIPIGDKLFDFSVMIDAFMSNHITTSVTPLLVGYSAVGVHAIHTPTIHTLQIDDRDTGLEILTHKIFDVHGKKCNLLFEVVKQSRMTPQKAMELLLNNEPAPGFYLFSTLVKDTMASMTEDIYTEQDEDSVFLVDPARDTVWRLVGANGICLVFSNAK